MRALLVALLLALATAVPVFADGDGGGDGYRPPAPVVTLGGPDGLTP